MGNSTFTIVYSNYTMQVFAWSGTPAENKKYLGNREILGSVTAIDSDDALKQWRTRSA
jgi:hypothetical protein